MKFIQKNKKIIIIIKYNIYERNKQKTKKKQTKKQQKKTNKKRFFCTMTSNIRLTSVDNDAQMDLMLTRIYFFSN